MGIYVGYEGARSCTGMAQPGCTALMSWYLGAYGRLGAVNSGIYNCRNVRGGSTTSLHGEGRADDLGVRPYSAAYGTALADKLRLNSAELGIQCIIWNRRIWSGSYPHAGWRPYNGVNPHVDHLHVELSWHAARTLTVAHIQAVLSGGGGSAGQPPGGIESMGFNDSYTDWAKNEQTVLSWMNNVDHRVYNIERQVNELKEILDGYLVQQFEVQLPGRVEKDTNTGFIRSTREAVGRLHEMVKRLPGASDKE